MLRTLAVLASAVILVVAAVVAAARNDASYTLDEVIDAFKQQGYTLIQPPANSGNPLRDRPEGTFLFPEPAMEAPFYVFVARNDLFANQFFAPLAKAGGGPEVFDALKGDVVVSSDASLTDVGLRQDQRRRIQAALQLLEHKS